MKLQFFTRKGGGFGTAPPCRTYLMFFWDFTWLRMNWHWQFKFL